MFHTLRFSRLLLLTTLILMLALSLSAQSFTATTYQTGSGPRKLVRADFNNDGYLDLATGNGDGTITVLLNNGNGTFHRLDATGGTGTIRSLVASDLNHDHVIDLVALSANADGSANVNVLNGNGDGTFAAPITIANRRQAQDVTVADFNGDGNLDIAVAWNSATTYANVTILFGDGSTTWSAQEYPNLGAQADIANGESPYQVNYIVSGDFNGDGKADFAIAECCGGFDVEIGAGYIYNNIGNSQFSGTQINNLPPNEMSTSDMGGDGSPDVILSGNGCHTPCTDLSVYEQNNGSVSAHSAPDPWSSKNSSTDRFESGIGGDFLNSGTKMLAYSAEGFDNATGTEGALLAFANRNADGSYAAPSTISTGGLILSSLVVGDFNHDGRLDVAGIASDVNYTSTPTNAVIVYTNTTATAQNCPTGAARTVSVCSPTAGSTVASPVRFLANPFSTTAISGMKIYLDSTAILMTPDDRISALLSIAPGLHNVVVKAWDATGPFSKSFSFSVGSGSGTCTATTNRTVNICAPLGGGTYASPVQVLAGLRSDSGVTAAQIYVDGTKVYQGGAGTTTVNQSLTMGVGSHKITVKGWDSTGSFSSSVTISVAGGTGSSCTASANRTVTICSPTSGSTVSSPIHVLAGLRSDSGVTAAQIYLDGTKVYQGPSGTTTVDQSITAGVGTHFITVKGWDNSGSFSSSVSITVN